MNELHNLVIYDITIESKEKWWFTYEQVIKIIADNAKLNDKQQLSEPDDYNSILIK